MRFLASATALFIGLNNPASYHQAVRADERKRTYLLAARREIREAIRAASSRIQVEDSFWEPELASRSRRNRPAVQPRFFTQGSVAYDLLVNPCRTPAQRLDLDDGMYVWVEFLRGKPALIAKSLFAMVEDALKPLCLKNGWALDQSKDTCVRVRIAADAHLDIPIYSAPRDVAESPVLAAADSAVVRVAKRAGSSYARLPSNEIMLAHRDGTWQVSDPLTLHEWVDSCVERYGEDFRRACRYFKGWRDYTWERCCLSSITVMVAVQKALDQLGGTHRHFPDDRLVYEIAQLLPNVLEQQLFNPAFPNQQILLNDWSPDERKEIVNAAQALADEMENALRGTADATLVVKTLRRAFGERIPYRPDVVRIMPPAAAAVATQPPVRVAAPKIINTTSG